MHLHVSESFSSTLWCPNLVGPYHISHNWLGNPNSSYASTWWLNHLSSISTHFVPPKSSKVILNKFWVKYFTIWAIIAHMTFCPTCKASSMFELDKGALDLPFGLLDINVPFLCKGASCGHLERPCSCTSLDRSNRSGMTGLTGLVRPELLWTTVNHMPQFLASMAHPIFWKLLLISWELSFLIWLDLIISCIVPLF